MTDATSGKVPVGECVAAAWRFFFDNWQQFLPAAIIVSIVSALAPLAGVTNAGGLLLGYVMVLGASVVFMAAVLRKAVRNEYAGPVGLAFGSDETRLIGVLLCMVLLLMPAIFVFGLIFSFAMAGRLAARGISPDQELDPEHVDLNEVMAEALATPMGALAAVGLAAVLIYVSARLFMTNAATIGERRIVFLQTWAWTRGNVLRVIGAMLLTALPVAIVNGLLGLFVGTMVGRQTGEVVVLTTSIVASLALNFVSTITSLPTIALGAHFYKGLRPPGFVLK